MSDEIATLIVRQIASLARGDAEDPALGRMLSWDATDLDWYLLAYVALHAEMVEA